jgi:Holliday junction resolvase RusA-like endonuclease
VTNVLHWNIPGDPIAKGRPRIYRDRLTNRVHGVTPQRTADWEKKACIIFRQQPVAQPLDEPILLSVCAVFARPHKYYRKQDPAGRLRHTVKPDGDNVLKATMDSLKLSGVVRDDSIICVAYISKWYAAKYEEPYVGVTLQGADGEGKAGG